MANPVIVNFDTHDGVRAVSHSEQSELTSAAADTVARLTILGRILVAIGTATADGSNTGDGTVTEYALAATGAPAKIGSYILTCIEAVTNGGVFKFVDPDGKLVADDITILAGAGGVIVFIGDGMTFKITDAATDFIVGDFFTLTIGVGTLLYAFYSPTGTNGVSIPVAVSLSEVVAAGAGDDPVGVMLGGKIDAAKLIIDGSAAGVGITEAIKDSLRTFGIIVESALETAALDNA